MKTYLVGGAVRDLYMDVDVQDYDYVVVGATPQQMLDKGFEQVGADFPVFLHPKTRHEYALARTERSTGNGYVDFEVNSAPNVTLDDDLERRDLTINALAAEIEDEQTYLIYDPHGGMNDINAKVFRHVSDAFAEDPVRVLRIARFRARFGSDWTVADETLTLIQSMAKRGVLYDLKPERVWKEMSRALLEEQPRLFFDTLLEMNVLHIIFPEIYALKSALENPRWHPEGDAYEHTMLVLTQAANDELSLQERYCALTHDFGKGLTPKELLPAHHGHENTGVPVVEAFSFRLSVPKAFRLAAMEICKNHMKMNNLEQLNAKTIVKLFDSLKYPDELFRVAQCDALGKLRNTNLDHLQNFHKYKRAYNSVKYADFTETLVTPKDIKAAFYRHRTAAVKAVKNGTKQKV